MSFLAQNVHFMYNYVGLWYISTPDIVSACKDGRCTLYNYIIWDNLDVEDKLFLKIISLSTRDLAGPG
jgi:hypothetical protein